MNRSFVYFLLVAVMVTWGLNVVALKVLVEQFEPVTMTALRIFTAGMAVIVVLLISKSWRWLSLRELKMISFISLFNIVAHHYFLSVGLTETSAVNGGLILGLLPILTAIAAILFLRARLTPIKLAGILVAFVGVSFVVIAGGQGGFQVAKGDIFIFLSAITQAVSFVLIKKTSPNIDIRLMTGWMMIIGSACLMVISLSLEPNGFASMQTGEWHHYVVFFGSAIIATAVGHMFYNYAIRLIGPSESAVFTNLNPFFALIGAALLLNESIYIEQIMGFVLVAIGVVGGSGAVDHWRSTRQIKYGVVKK
ncbi:DMT family transporter [Jeotgalibacillus soli]|uniref:EamA domain-containing protein n=1 Tax=Jeotgalibacillus soli TaxID=889306 RepID=A0A0C2SCZ9_9BACL|nr:DMT family transporter [Jeotgalibacillus soli]KIL51844.1 hypothetical protein KP78_02140 [Jeotgalibacillus soli]